MDTISTAKSVHGAQNLIELSFEINQVEEHMYTVHFLLDNNAIIIFLF